jgi:hypothetical protein
MRNCERGPERSASAGSSSRDHLIGHADDDRIPFAKVTSHERHLSARKTGSRNQRDPALCSGPLSKRRAKQREANEAHSNAKPTPLDAMHLGLLLAPPLNYERG